MMPRLLPLLCLCALVGVLEASPRKTHYYVPNGTERVSQQTADAVYKTVADAYAQYTDVLQHLRQTNVQSSKSALQAVQARMRAVQPYFHKDMASVASKQAKDYFASKSRACVAVEKALPDDRLAEIDSIMSHHPRLNRLREDTYRLFVEFFKAVVTDYSHMGVF